MPSKTTSIVAEEVLPRNTARKSIVFLNEDAADSIYLKKERAENLTVSATDHDYRIGPGGVIALNNINDGSQAIQERWTCVASANTPRIAFFETEDIIR
jgi:hypothetical protein